MFDDLIASLMGGGASALPSVVSPDSGSNLRLDNLRLPDAADIPKSAAAPVTPPAPSPTSTPVDGFTITAKRPAPNYDNSSAVASAQSALSKANAAAQQVPPSYAQGGSDNPGIFGLLPPHMQHGTLRNVLGALGDAFLVGSGRAAQYEPRMQRQEIGNAMAGIDMSDPKSVSAAVNRIAATGVPGSAEMAQQILERQQMLQQNNWYRQSVINDRNQSTINRQAPFVAGQAQKITDPDQYAKYYQDWDSRIKAAYGPDHTAAEYGLPDPSDWKPGSMDYAGMTGGQIAREDTSKASIDERADAAAKRDATTRRGQDMRSGDSRYSTNHRAGRSPTSSGILQGLIDKQNRGETLTPAEQAYWSSQINGKKGGSRGLLTTGGGNPPVVTNGDVAYVRAHPEAKAKFIAHFGAAAYNKYVTGTR